MPSQDHHPTHNDLELLYCNELHCDGGTATRASIEQHLLSCRRCRLLLNAIRRFVEQLATGRIRTGTKVQPMKADHISVDDMERYHLGKVQEPELALLEEHVLWCHDCLDRMEATERFIDMVRRGIVCGGFDLELEA
jgi:hypothetical protein